jgi:hypothetical protein
MLFAENDRFREFDILGCPFAKSLLIPKTPADIGLRRLNH